MRKLMMLVVMMALLPVPAIAIEPGTYSCVIDHMVGIQPKHPGQSIFDWSRFAGQINPDPEHFVLTISAFSEVAAACDGSDEDRALRWPYCEPHMKYQAEIPANRKHGQWLLVSMNGFTFYGGATMLDIIAAYGSARFRIAELGGFANYLSEGTCRRF